MKINKKICKIKQCDKKHYAKGFCYKHYLQIKKYGKIIRTVMDPNKFILRNDIYRVKTYDKKGKYAGEFIIDKDDVNKCKKYKWHINHHGYVSAFTKKPNKKYIALQNFIMNCESNRKIQVDHNNNNKLDNRKSNLRICTITQNNTNRSIMKNNKSGHKGVCWSKKAGKWVSYISIDGKRKHLGCFNKLEEAAETYNIAALKHFGEFANLNEVN